MTVQSNPLGAGQGYNSIEESQPGSVRRVKVGAVAVSAGDVVVWNAINTATLPTVIPQDAGTSDPALVAGVATDSADIGEAVQIVRSGPCKVNIGAATVSAGQQAIPHATTDGAAQGVTADATTVVGDTFGVFLGAEIGTTNQAYVDVRIGS